MNEFETVVGLEVHIQLLTQSKLFCSDATQFGSEPNTQVSPISLAHPGTLPMLNSQAVELAIRLGIALQCQIAPSSHFDRKHYFYPDLPKGYQTSQLTHPILIGGRVPIKTTQGEKDIAIHHIHLEEDAGKSIHELPGSFSYIDLNRAGMPLLELVTDPVIASGDEAFQFLTNLRKLVRWLKVCDGNMEEGSMRCDANISVRKRGETQLGTKVEVKNLNSIRNVKRAIEVEAERQISLIKKGAQVTQQTRGYDANLNQTNAQRDKEDAMDYRYFPCPDLPSFTTTPQVISTIANQMPELPEPMAQRLVQQMNLSVQDAGVLTEDRPLADFFLQLTQLGVEPKPAANWLIGPVKSWLNEQQQTIEAFPLSSQQLSNIINLVTTGVVNFSMASGRLMQAAIQQPLTDVQLLAAELGIVQTTDRGELENWVNNVLEKMPDKVQEYKKGKKGLMGLFVGEVKKLSKGQADPQVVTKMLMEKLT